MLAVVELTNCLRPSYTHCKGRAMPPPSCSRYFLCPNKIAILGPGGETKVVKLPDDKNIPISDSLVFRREPVVLE